MADSRRKTPTRILAQAIEGRDGTKTEIAASIGMTVEQLRHIEAGRRQPILTQAIAIEDEFEIPARSWV
jgi:DNA-binding XRE family transcriptional regulator